MATVIPFPAPLSHPRARELRGLLGPLSADELRGLRALSDGLTTREPDGILGDVLADYLAADADAATWKAWPRAFGRQRYLP